MDSDRMLILHIHTHTPMGPNYTSISSVSWMDNLAATHQDFPSVTAPLALATFLAQVKLE